MRGLHVSVHNAAVLDRVLILSASAGAGHVRAAEALARAFARLGAAREVRHVDTLQFTNKTSWSGSRAVVRKAVGLVAEPPA